MKTYKYRFPAYGQIGDNDEAFAYKELLEKTSHKARTALDLGVSSHQRIPIPLTVFLLTWMRKVMSMPLTCTPTQSSGKAVKTT